MEIKTDEKNAGGLIEEIERQTRLKIDEIIGRARARADEIIANAKKQEEQILQAEKEKAQKTIEMIKHRAQSTLKMELRKIRLEMKKEFADSVIKKTREISISFRNHVDYKKFLVNAILEGIEVIDKPEIIVEFSPDDKDYFTGEFEKEIVDKCKNDLKKNVSIRFVRGNFDDIGIIVKSQDGFVIYENTFSARMRNLYDSIYSELLGEEI